MMSCSKKEIHEMQVEKLIALFKKKQFNESYWYLIALVFSFLISILAIILSDSLNRSKTISGALFGFLIVFISLTLLIFILNSLKKFFSIRAILLAIELAKANNWDWSSVSYLSKPSRMHSAILTHPITIFLFAKKLEQDGYATEANQLLDQAIEKKPFLMGIEIEKNGAQHLADNILNERFSKTFIKAKKMCDR
jgi:hypothetical protein